MLESTAMISYGVDAGLPGATIWTFIYAWATISANIEDMK